MARAYLVVSLRTDKSIPTFAGISIYSEPHPTTMGSISTAIIAEAEGTDFGDAERKLREAILSQPGPLGWMAKWILLSPAEQKALLRQ